MDTIIDSCFLCTKDQNCVPLDNNIVSQVEYLLPEITITKLGIPLRICSVCYEALYAFNKFKHFCVESCRRLEARIKGAQTSGALGPPQTQLPPGRASETIQLHTDTNSNNAEEIVIKVEKPEETQIPESCSSILKNILLNQCSSREHNTEGGSAAPDTSATSFDKSGMIEEVFIKEEPLEDSPEDMNTYDMLQCTLNENNESNTTEHTIETNCATINTSEPSHTKPQLNETIFIKEEQMEIQPETITNSTNVVKSMSDQNDEDNQIEQYTSAESATLDTSELWEGSSEDSEDESESDNQIYSGQKRYQCDICSKKFKKKSDFDRHKKIHTGIKDFVCDICNKPFSQKSNLITHRKTHSEVKDFQCDICNKAFRQKTTLVNHIKSHLSIKEFSCDICNKTFVKKTTLDKHVLVHSEIKDFRCEICNKSYRHYGTLTTHMKIHSGVKDFECDYCDKSFTRKFDFVRHRKIHIGVKDFQCNVCSKSFIQKTNLVSHMKIHLGIKDYHCELCGKSFTQHGTLVNHMKIHSISEVDV